MLKSFLENNDNKSSFLIGFGMILIAGVLGLANMITSSKTPDAVSTNFELYAKTYYEEGFYDEFLKTTLEGNIENFEKYTSGFEISARQIFTGINIDPSEYFVKDGVECSLDDSKVLFYPEEPYGKKDYRINISLEC